MTQLIDYKEIAKQITDSICTIHLNDETLRERHLASLLASIQHKILSEEIKPKYIADDNTLAVLCFTISYPYRDNKEYIKDLINSAMDILRETAFFDRIEYTDISEDENSNDIYTHITLFYGTKIVKITPYEIQSISVSVGW